MTIMTRSATLASFVLLLPFTFFLAILQGNSSVGVGPDRPVGLPLPLPPSQIGPGRPAGLPLRLPSSQIGPGRPAGLPLPLGPSQAAPGRPLALPIPLSPSQIVRLPLPPNFAPSKIPLNLREAEVSLLLGLLPPNQREMIEAMRVKYSQILPTTLPTTLPDGSHNNISLDLRSIMNISAVNTSATGVNDNANADVESSISPQSSTTLTTSFELFTTEANIETTTIDFLPEEKNSSVQSAKNVSHSRSDTQQATQITSETTSSLSSSVAFESIEPSSTAIMPTAPITSETSSLSLPSLADAIEPSMTMPSGPVTEWVPLYLSPNERPSGLTPDEEPIIITMPDEPSIFEMTVKHQLAADTSSNMPSDLAPRINATKVHLRPHESLNATSVLRHSEIISTESLITANATSFLNDSRSHSKAKVAEPEIVYGRPIVTMGTYAVQPTAPSFSTNSDDAVTLSPSSTIKTSFRATTPKMTAVGKPVVIPVDMDEVSPGVRSNQRSPQPPVLTEPGQGSVYIDGRPTFVGPKPNSQHNAPTMQVGSAVNVHGDEEVPNPFNSLKPGPFQGSQISPVAATKPPVVRRPPFKPRPSVPLVRIDTCIVGDDTTCDQSLHERCQTELGISSCHCKPGFARNLPRSPCLAVTTLALSIKVDRIGDKKLIFSRNYLNSNSEDYQYLEYESLQAINSAFAMSNLARVFLGARINRFYSVAGKTIVNATIHLELNNATSTSSIRRYVQQELSRIVAIRNNNIGDR